MVPSGRWRRRCSIDEREDTGQRGGLAEGLDWRPLCRPGAGDHGVHRLLGQPLLQLRGPARGIARQPPDVQRHAHVAEALLARPGRQRGLDRFAARRRCVGRDDGGEVQRVVQQPPQRGPTDRAEPLQPGEEIGDRRIVQRVTWHPRCQHPSRRIDAGAQCPRETVRRVGGPALGPCPGDLDPRRGTSDRCRPAGRQQARCGDRRHAQPALLVAHAAAPVALRTRGGRAGHVRQIRATCTQAAAIRQPAFEVNGLSPRRIARLRCAGMREGPSDGQQQCGDKMFHAASVPQGRDGLLFKNMFHEKHQ